MTQKHSAQTTPPFPPPPLEQLSFPADRPLLGLDHGSKTIGVAISDTLHMIASPLTTIRRKSFSADTQVLLEIVEQHRIGGIIIGLPLNMDGSSGPRAQSVRAYVRNLKTRTDLPETMPVGFQDERLSSLAAERAMLEADLSRGKRAAIIDQVSATIILQSALDRRRNGS